jgi:hypothetical protein
MNMPNRRSEVLVTEFLRDALAVDALGVPELEARARATGLLGERQSITHIKVIRSRRAGFGVRSQWLWQMPRQSEASIEPELGPGPEPRVAIPIDWVQRVACLDHDRGPDDVPRHRWRQFVDDCRNFLSPSENWAERAARLGWNAMALFGCAPKRPLHRDWAVIELAANGSLHVGAPTQGTSRCHGSSGAGARGTCDRCDQKNAATWTGSGLPIAADAIQP